MTSSPTFIEALYGSILSCGSLYPISLNFMFIIVLVSGKRSMVSMRFASLFLRRLCWFFLVERFLLEDTTPWSGCFDPMLTGPVFLVSSSNDLKIGGRVKSEAAVDLPKVVAFGGFFSAAYTLADARPALLLSRIKSAFFLIVLPCCFML